MAEFQRAGINELSFMHEYKAKKEKMFRFDAMTDIQWLLIGMSAVAAGAVNALAGGGTLITFPLLIAVGILPWLPMSPTQWRYAPVILPPRLRNASN